MYSLILKISHSTRVKDAIAIARGLYRVSEASLTPSHYHHTSSWMHQQLQQQPSQPISPLSSAPNSTSNPLSENSTSNRQQITLGDIGKKHEGHQAVPMQSLNRKQYLKQFEVKESSNTKSTDAEISTIPSNRIRRIFQFGKLGLSLASASIFSKDKNESHYQDLAEKVTNQLCKMRGAPLKLAQMLSIQQDNLIPMPIRRAFEKARQSAHVIPRQEVELMLSRNLGDDWAHKFKNFEFTPVASASIGQVHKAVLLNGESVAVKVQYYQVKESIESDIQNLGLLFKMPGVFPKGMYPEKILSNMRIELMQECDYLLQRFYQQKYDHYLRQSFGPQAQLYRVPKVLPELTTPEILTSEFLTGIKMKDLETEEYPQQIRDEIGRRIMKLTFKQLFEMGIMQSDPNPSNYTYDHTRDQLNLYDFGATHIYKKQFLESYYAIIKGSVKQDLSQIWEASIQTGFVTGEQNITMKNSHIESILITGEPLRHQGKYDFGSQEITKRIYQTIPLMLKNRLRPPPEEVYSLHRKLSGSYLVCIRLRARVDCKRIFDEISFKTLACHQKYEPSNQRI